MKAGDRIIDMGDMPDMVPTMAVLSAFRQGTTKINRVAHLRIKESNRLAALVTELNKIGAVAQEEDDSLMISSGALHGATIETYNDHRIAMSFAPLRAWLCRTSPFETRAVWTNPSLTLG